MSPDLVPFDLEVEIIYMHVFELIESEVLIIKMKSHPAIPF